MSSIGNIYVPEVEKFENSKEFSYLADFFNQHGVYTLIPRGTYEYKLFWDEVKHLCINGFTNSLGIRITGHHFFYLNFCRINALNESIGK